MRTKRTGDDTSGPMLWRIQSDVATTTSPAIQSPTPQAPNPLSTGDKERIKTWLDKQARPFSVTTFPLSKKRKRESSSRQVQDDLWEDRLALHYEVKPREKWESLRKYKKFTVGDESIATGDCILVKHDDSERASIDVAAQWKAKVLEVRALDQEHVYIRVAWLNRPEDLDYGRKAYHGKNELIPTNTMDVIDAMAVNGSLEVLAWNDGDDDSGHVEEDQYFWRQTYDSVNGGGFSKLHQICIDNQPQNPDEMILQCSNSSCQKWLHVKCIQETAAQRAYDEAKAATGVNSSAKKKGRPSNNLTSSDDSPTARRKTENPFTAKVFIKGKSSIDEESAAEKTEVVFTHASDGRQYAEALCCLHCGHQID